MEATLTSPVPTTGGVIRISPAEFSGGQAGGDPDACVTRGRRVTPVPYTRRHVTPVPYTRRHAGLTSAVTPAVDWRRDRATAITPCDPHEVVESGRIQLGDKLGLSRRESVELAQLRTGHFLLLRSQRRKIGLNRIRPHVM